MRYKVTLPSDDEMVVEAGTVTIMDNGALRFLDEYGATVAAFSRYHWAFFVKEK